MVLGWWDNCAHWQWADLARRPAWSRLLHVRIEATDHENYHHFDVPVTAEHDHLANPRARHRTFGRYLAPSQDFFDVFLRGTASPDTVPRVCWQLAGSGAGSFLE